MRLGARHCFSLQVVVFCLTMLLGLLVTAGASPLKNKLPKSNQSSSKKPPATLKNAPAQAPPLQKPKPFSPARLTQEDPLAPLDQLVVKQQVSLAPYMPLVQAIDVAVDYGRLAMNLCTPKEHRYAGSLNILFRRDIQFSGTLGYSQLVHDPIYGNQNAYMVKGQYGSLGLEYFIKYNLYNSLYTGLRYSKSYFESSTVPTSDSEKIISKALTASWWELVIGSEQQLFHNLGLYAGFVLHLKCLGSFEKFAPATNYTVPGYGRSVQAAVPSITLYIKYKIFFLEKQITFNEPLAR